MTTLVLCLLSAMAGGSIGAVLMAAVSVGRADEPDYEALTNEP